MKRTSLIRTLTALAGGGMLLNGYCDGGQIWYLVPVLFVGGLAAAYANSEFGT